MDTDEKRAEFVAKEFREHGIIIDPACIVKNEALRTIAKLLLNSMCELFVVFKCCGAMLTCNFQGERCVRIR